jgi:hypothetical protein
MSLTAGQAFRDVIVNMDAYLSAEIGHWWQSHTNFIPRILLCTHAMHDAVK